MSFSASSSRSNRVDGNPQPAPSAACARSRSPTCCARSSASPCPRWRGRTGPISRLCVDSCCAPRRPPSITRTGSPEEIRVYLEIGRQRTFAGAVDWPGWCRSGRDEAGAVAALLAAAPRYARALRSSRLGFAAPVDAPSGDDARLPEDEIHRLQAVLKACWRAFDAAADAAAGRTLSKGPRGGGRDL